MTYLHALILGIVEGLTEFLPVSSTGHLIVASRFLGLDGIAGQVASRDENFLKTFEIAIQLGAILSVVVLYWRRFFLSWETFKRVTVAFIPTAILGLAFYKIIKTYLLGNVGVVIGSLFIGGIILILFEIMMGRRARLNSTPQSEVSAAHEIEKLSYKKAACVGACQAIAFIPGVSRSGATIIGGIALGLSRAAIVEFSFLLAVPTMAAATGLDLIKNASAFSSSDFSLLAIGGSTSFIIALLSIKFLIKFVQKHTFIGFGVYRIFAAVAIYFLLT